MEATSDILVSLKPTGRWRCEVSFVSLVGCGQASDVYKEEGETWCGPLEAMPSTSFEVTLMQTQKNSLLKCPYILVQSICERSLMSPKSITSMSMGIQWCRHICRALDSQSLGRERAQQ